MSPSKPVGGASLWLGRMAAAVAGLCALSSGLLVGVLPAGSVLARGTQWFKEVSLGAASVLLCLSRFLPEEP